MSNSNFSFEIIDHIAVLSENPSSHWKRCLRKVSWNHGIPKWDIRDWSEPDPMTGQSKMSRGITLTDAEMNVIRELVLQGRL